MYIRETGSVDKYILDADPFYTWYMSSQENLLELLPKIEAKYPISVIIMILIIILRLNHYLYILLVEFLFVNEILEIKK